MTETPLLTGPRLAPIRPIRRLAPTESSIRPLPSQPSTPLSNLPSIPTTTRRTISFDLESVAAGYADPQWVPSIVTAWAYSWVGDDDVVVRALPVADLHNLEARRVFLQPLLDAISEADVVTGHNIERFDLPLLNAETRYLSLPNLQPVLAQDTIRFPKTKGFKKGLDNLGVLLDVPAEKLAMNHAEWQRAYAEPGLEGIKARCASDVLMHKQIREAMRARGWLKTPRVWNPS